MKNSKSVFSMFLLIAVASIGLSSKAQWQSSHVNTREVSNILQRLAQSLDPFRNSLSAAVERSRADGRPENDVNSFERDFEYAISQLNNRFRVHRAGAADIRNVLQKASPINDFMSRRRFDAQARNDWAAVRSNLESLASAYAVKWQWNPQTLPPVSTSRSYRLSDRDLDQLVRRIGTGGDTFRSSLTDAFDRSRYDQTRSEGNMNDAVAGFKSATDQLRNRFDARQLMAGDVKHVLQQAVPIDVYMRNNKLTTRAQNDWSTLRGDLEGLASAYNIAPNWGNSPSAETGYKANDRLTGTFRLDSSRSDDARDIAARATRNLSNTERQGVSDRLLARLESPEMLAIERIGSTVTISSSRAPQTTFTADGIEHQEQLSGGRFARLTATLIGDQLIISSTGSRGSDFSVTFDGIENGRLRVTRTIYLNQLPQPVVVNSVYDRTSDVAKWNLYNGSQPVLIKTASSSSDFIVRDGESVVAVLSTYLTTKQAKQGDRFSMIVRQPTQYAGAVIEGTVAGVDRGGRLSGRSQMSLNFETIRLRNGQTYSFAGVMDSARTQNGETVQVENEGAVRSDTSQTTRTVERAGIGTAIGAIIGAIAGGGKGAMIGGVIGAAGGAGSVYAQGKEDLELPSGTEVTIRASAPR